MGAWGYDIFDDDTAYEFMDEIAENAASFFKKSFENALRADYLDYEACYVVIVSAAYLDNLLNGTLYRTDCEYEVDVSNVNNFKKLYKGPDLSNLRIIAISALEVVMSEKAELNELWLENEKYYPKWRENLEKLIERLNRDILPF